MGDRYDEAIAELRAEAATSCWPAALQRAWYHTTEAPGGALFQFCTPSGHATEDPPEGTSGCLTMVRRGCYHAWTPGLTAAIRADERLPDRAENITPEHLPVFAEWQRKLDHEIRGGGEVTPDAVASAG